MRGSQRWISGSRHAAAIASASSERCGRRLTVPSVSSGTFSAGTSSVWRPVRALSPWLDSPLRRALDVITAALALVVTSPLLAIAMLAIRLETHGHALYRQRRVGRRGDPFEVYKLRTMVAGAETMGAGLAINVGDERITRVGALLRRTSLDELPNLFNVLRGEMSLI